MSQQYTIGFHVQPGPTKTAGDTCPDDGKSISSSDPYTLPKWRCHWVELEIQSSKFLRRRWNRPHTGIPLGDLKGRIRTMDPTQGIFKNSARFNSTGLWRKACNVEHSVIGCEEFPGFHAGYVLNPWLFWGSRELPCQALTEARAHQWAWWCRAELPGYEILLGYCTYW